MKMDYWIREKRRYVRVYETMPAAITFFSDSFFPDLPQKKNGTVRNISSSGACVEAKINENILVENLSTEAVKIGAKLKLPGSNHDIKALGRVVWMRKQESNDNSFIMGVDFSDITTTVQDAIRAYVVDFYLEEEQSKK